MLDDFTANEEVIVEAGGAPRAAVISFERYQKLREIARRERLATARAEWQRLAEDIGDRNSDLTQEQIDERADRFTREFYEDLAREGKLRFERDLKP